jgi:hypothetical protein
MIEVFIFVYEKAMDLKMTSQNMGYSAGNKISYPSIEAGDRPW